jgi:hypothetical protein
MNEETDLIDSNNQAFRALARLLAIMRLSGFVMACYAMLQGSLVILGGPHRFAQIGYKTAMIIPGAPASWGWALLIFGILAFVGLKNRMYNVGMIGMFGAGVWSFAFGGAFLVSSIQYPEANLTAMVTYGKDAVLFILMAVVHRMLAQIKTKPEANDA